MRSLMEAAQRFLVDNPVAETLDHGVNVENTNKESVAKKP